MKFRLLLLFFIGLLPGSSTLSFGQIVGGNVFLQGHWLEIGVDSMGAFGTCSSPTGYHAHGPDDDATDSCFTEGQPLDACYDWGHDGWGVGTPCEMGDYTIPGTPQEGWGMEYNGVEYRNWANGDYSGSFTNAECTGPFDIHGTITGYSNTGGIITGTFSGAAAGLNVIQETRVDTEASWVVITTRIYNTTALPITGVYYERTCDPDNTSFWTGGTSITENVIVHQNEDARHEVMVGTYGTDSGTGYYYNRYNSWMALGTKDCRAQAFVIKDTTPSYSDLYPETGITPADIWAGTEHFINGLGDSDYDDVGIILLYNLGTLAAAGSPGDSAIISYAYIYDGANGIDSAFPDPQLLVGTTLEPNATEPYPSYDTLNSCSYPGVNSFPLSILHASDKDWSWSSWTWSPSIGLAATTGVNNTLNITALSGQTTYTITGTDSAVNMMSCNYRVFYLTVIPCFHATSNSPGPVYSVPGSPDSALCATLGDTLILTGHGDSTGATYFWYGPAGFTGTGQTTIRTGLTMADTGLYHVVKTVAGSADTVSTEVVLKSLPVVTVTSNSPICSGGANVLSLTASPDSVGETFAWAGPDGFTSTTQNPSETGLPSTASGIYKVVTMLNGCLDSSSLFVTIDSTPALPTIGSNAPICSLRDTLKFTSTDVTPGVTYTWNGPLGFTSPLQNPYIPANVPVAVSGIYTVTATLSVDGFACYSQNTLTVVVDSTPYLPIVGSNSPICSGTALLLTATSTAGANYNWTGPNLFTSVVQNPAINPAPTLATGSYYVAATIIYPGIPGGCISDTASVYVTVDSTPAMPIASSNSPGPPGPVLCQGDSLKLTATDNTEGVNYAWAGPDAFTSTEENPVLINVGPAATGSYTLTVALGMCSATAITVVTVTPTPPLTATNNGPVCTGIQDTLLLQAVSGPGATYSWAGPYTFSSLNQSPFRTPVIYEYGGVYEVTAFWDGCPSETVNDTVIVRQTPAPPIVPWLNYCQFYNVPPLQAMGDSILWYSGIAVTDTGTLVAPVPPTSNIGTSWYYASQTLMGCTSAIDSIKVVVNPKPTVTVSNDTAVCPHDTLTLTAADTDPIAYYHWAPDMYINDTSSASITVRPETDVIYTVVATNQYDCTDTAYVTVNVLAAALLNLGDSVTLYPGQSYQLDPLTNCSSFLWFPPAGLSNANISNPVASPELSTIYTVAGETSWGCSATSSISIYVDPESLLALPNAFTPGSGVNSLFKIIKTGEATLNYFRVFDRWGVLVFETTDIDAGWDGTYKGTAQPFGVYVYEVSATTSIGTVFIKHGNVTLVR